MKKVILSILAVATLMMASCSSDDSSIADAGSASTSVGLLKSDGTQILSSSVTSDVTITQGEYALTGPVIVASGATLTIEAGTKITTSSSGTDVYISVLKGAKIMINGTASNPVVMASASGNPGDWGGLVLCGKATTTEGIDAAAEVGGFLYGGDTDTDSSGSITNLVLKGTGASIKADSEYNGISFYAVGSGTTVENIAIINGADDGVEFFGGTVNASNIYLENNEDDSVDWTEGWNGTVNNVYVSHTKEGFSTVFEGDGSNGNPTFTNVTAISSVDGTALQFKKTSGATITGLHLDGYATDLDLKAEGALSDVQIEGADADIDTTLDEASKKYRLTATTKDATQVDISTWSFKDATL